MTDQRNKGTIKSRWDKLDRDRQAVLERARRCSELTIPSLLPPEGTGEGQVLDTPYQGLGARGINNLASKLLLTLLPPNNTFFRLTIDGSVMQALEEQDLVTEVENKLADIENLIAEEIETKALRVPVFEALRLLIGTGNALTYQPDEGGMEVYKLDQYVVKRNALGEVLEIITKETVDVFSLPDELQDKVIKEEGLDRESSDQSKDVKRDNEVDLYTRIILTEDKKSWEVSQECEGILIEDAMGNYPYDECPWIPLRWTASSNEDYGRGLVEEYLGDFVTLESLTKALVEGTTIASQILGLVNPAGVTRTSKLVEANNGDFIEGREEDVSFLQLDKHMDYSLCYQTMEKIETRLKHAFLLMDAVRRDAERVTAEEIRTMARELEDSLGGVYSLLSLEFQMPLVKRMMSQMESKGQLPELPEDDIRPAIVTGLEALGRGHDLDKLMHLMQAIEPLGPEAIQKYMKAGDYIKRACTALGIDTNGLVRSEEEVQQMQQQAEQAQMQQQLAPKAMEMAQQQQQKGQGQPQQQQGGAE